MIAMESQALTRMKRAIIQSRALRQVMPRLRSCMLRSRVRAECVSCSAPSRAFDWQSSRSYFFRNLASTSGVRG